MHVINLTNSDNGVKSDDTDAATPLTDSRLQAYFDETPIGQRTPANTARDLANDGWHVIQLPAQRKEPPPRDWLKSLAPDYRPAMRMYRGDQAWPHATARNIALRMGGPSRLLAIDLDVAKPGEVMTADATARRTAIDNDARQLVTEGKNIAWQYTRNGGFHFIARVPGN